MSEWESWSNVTEAQLLHEVSPNEGILDLSDEVVRMLEMTDDVGLSTRMDHI